MHYDPHDLQAQEREKAERETRDRIERERDEDDVKWLMRQKQGRRFVWRLLTESRVFHSSFSSDALAMAFSEGKRNFGLRVLATINAVCPERYPQMAKEFKETECPTNQ